ncbi:MAG: DUF615 domain-containing protein [Nitrospirae bacterium]|nr:DUF615 domain-containing protein [Nitrospirota bacterium]
MEYKSKSQKKREAEALQELGGRLVKLPAERIGEIGLPEDIYQAVMFAKTVKGHGGLRRQMQYIGTLMRRIDPAPVQEALHNLEAGDYQKTLEFREMERWRDELIAGNAELMEEILKKFPAADRQKLTQLSRNAIKEKEGNKPPKAFRALFRYLKAIRKAKK